MKEKDKYNPTSNNPEHLDENQIAQYAEYLRHETSQIPDELIDHVESCPYCRAEIMAVADLLDSMPDLAEEPDSADAGYPLSVSHRSGFSILKLLRTAAAVAAVVLIAWFIQQKFTGGTADVPMAANEEKDPVPVIDSIKHEVLTNSSTVTPSVARKTVDSDTILYASAFIPNQTYENLVGAKYRSGTDPKIKGPGNSHTFAPGDIFTLGWESLGGDQYVLIILDNDTTIAKEIKISGESPLTWKIDLKPGLYYWKFQGKDELWKVGKFRVIRPLSAQ